MLYLLDLVFLMMRRLILIHSGTIAIGIGEDIGFLFGKKKITINFTC